LILGKLYACEIFLTFAKTTARVMQCQTQSDCSYLHSCYAELTSLFIHKYFQSQTPFNSTVTANFRAPLVDKYRFQ